MNINLLFNQFIGEISPLIEGRIDSPENQMGAKRMENFIPMLTGGIRKRPGTFYVKDPDANEKTKARLIDWLLSDGTCLLIEITNSKIQSWKDNVVSIITQINYNDIDIYDLQFAFVNNSMWIVHPERKVKRIITNNSGDSFEVDEPAFYKEIDLNAPSGIQDCSPCNGSGYLFRNQPCKKCNSTGRLDCNTCKNTGKIQCPICADRYIYFNNNKTYMEFNVSLSETGFGGGSLSGNVTINGNQILFVPTQITPSITLYGEISTDQKTIILTPSTVNITSGDRSIIKRWAGVYKNDLGQGGDNIFFDTKGSGLIRCPVCSGTGKVATNTCTQCQGSGVFDCITCNTLGDITCTKCNGLSYLTCDVCRGIGTLDNICDTCTGTGRINIDPDIQQEPMFNTPDNYPSCIAFNAGRLCLAGTNNEPNRIYMSMAPDSMTGESRYLNFTPSDGNGIVTASHAIVIEENDMHGSKIQWLAASRQFVAATERATWSDTGEIPTPATFDMNIVEYAGSDKLQAKGTREIMIYAGRGSKNLRALLWSQEAQGGFVGVDISEQAAHLFGSGIKDFTVSDFPFPMLWVVTNNGELISCTINISGGITAYARHVTDGLFESVAVIKNNERDIVYFVVNRGIKFNPMLNIEYLIINDMVNDNFSDSHYVDAGEVRTPPEPTNIIDGLERFEGKIINIFADGATEPPVKVENGQAKLQGKFNKIHLGLPFKSVFSHNTRQLPANGTSLGKKRRIEKVTLKLYRSLGGKVGTSEEKATELLYKRLGEYILGSAPEPLTGEIEVTIAGNIDTTGDLIITHNEPVPFTLLAIAEKIAISEV